MDVDMCVLVVIDVLNIICTFLEEVSSETGQHVTLSMLTPHDLAAAMHRAVCAMKLDGALVGVVLVVKHAVGPMQGAVQMTKSVASILAPMFGVIITTIEVGFSPRCERFYVGYLASKKANDAYCSIVRAIDDCVVILASRIDRDAGNLVTVVMSLDRYDKVERDVLTRRIDLHSICALYSLPDLEIVMQTTTFTPRTRRPQGSNIPNFGVLTPEVQQGRQVLWNLTACPSGPSADFRVSIRNVHQIETLGVKKSVQESFLQLRRNYKGVRSAVSKAVGINSSSKKRFKKQKKQRHRR